MQTIREKSALQKQLNLLRQTNKSIALVPTMGNLHSGHLSLIKLAQEKADIVVCSIFVNPSQFGVNEDFSTYPRTIEADQQKLAEADTDILFLPSVKTMYPLGLPMQVEIAVPILANKLCGASRPTHFQGVATVVTKLFNLTQPQIAIFGKKDFQQLRIIETLNQELGWSIEIFGAPIMREPNQLAMSSRNQYLTTDEKSAAAKLYETLMDAKSDILKPNFDYSIKSIQSLCDHAQLYLADQGFIPEYFSLCRISDLAQPTSADKELVLLAAAKMGQARLIDNIDFIGN